MTRAGSQDGVSPAAANQQSGGNYWITDGEALQPHNAHRSSQRDENGTSSNTHSTNIGQPIPTFRKANTKFLHLNYSFLKLNNYIKVILYVVVSPWLSKIHFICSLERPNWTSPLSVSFLTRSTKPPSRLFGCVSKLHVFNTFLVALWAKSLCFAFSKSGLLSLSFLTHSISDEFSVLDSPNSSPWGTDRFPPILPRNMSLKTPLERLPTP